MKNFTDQQINDAYKSATKAIQETINDGESSLASMLLSLGTKLNLHVDQLGLIAVLNRNMLLGLVGPEEFLKELITTGVSDKDAREIISEINKKIFIPLHEQMRNGTTTVPESEEQAKKAIEQIKPTSPKEVEKWAESVPPAPRAPQVNAAVPSYAYAPQPKQSSPQYFHLQNKLAPTPRASLEATQGAAPPPKAVAPVVAEIQPSPVIIEAAPPTSPEATKGTAHIELKEILAQVVPEQVSTLRIAEVRQVDKAEVPPNLPGVVQPTVPVKEYVADPYREPIDETGSK